ncbi:spindle and kinetochore-associated protein 2 isoform X1 [Cucurbita moschata]|uniref:Protein FAM33A n=1 Tax=Cucurbita moschata TaxID=3662 RepID=A0A6J1F6V9_CUCMO|nr:spindle and kinetochore-associated protein 2 isoform X1 [Cucurbita moschata]
MGLDHLHQHHQAADGLTNLFTKANHDLSVVQYRLEKEFQQIYPDSANPMKLALRIKKIRDDISTLKEQCREVLMAKQDVIDKARTVLVGNRNMVHKMQASMGKPFVSDDDDPAFVQFKQITEEWTTQVQSKIGEDGQEDAESSDVNKLLFSAVVQE